MEIFLGKFEDQDSHAPRANLLCELLYRYTKIVYHQHEIVNMERLMLSMSGWRLMIPTAALFAPYFTAVGIDERTDFVGKSLVTSKNHNKNASDLDTQGTNFLPNTLADTPSPEPLSSVFDVERIKEAMEKIVDRMLLACLKGSLYSQFSSQPNFFYLQRLLDFGFEIPENDEVLLNFKLFYRRFIAILQAFSARSELHCSRSSIFEPQSTVFSSFAENCHTFIERH